jgi:hypothetical protein
VRAAPESADEYPHVVAMLTDGRRVIECAADIQWVIQVHKGRPLNPWFTGPGSAAGAGVASAAAAASFMDEYARSGDACWKILAKENPEGFLRLGAYLAPKEMQLDVFMSSSSDAEIDAMIEVLREKVLEAQANPPMKLIEQKVKAEDVG